MSSKVLTKLYSPLARSPSYKNMWASNGLEKSPCGDLPSFAGRSGLTSIVLTQREGIPLVRNSQNTYANYAKNIIFRNIIMTDYHISPSVPDFVYQEVADRLSQCELYTAHDPICLCDDVTKCLNVVKC